VYGGGRAWLRAGRAEDGEGRQQEAVLAQAYFLGGARGPERRAAGRSQQQQPACNMQMQDMQAHPDLQIVLTLGPHSWLLGKNQGRKDWIL
jgi:hypothetical protein